MKLRSGYTTIELLIAGMLLATLAVSTMPTLAWVVRQRDAAERRQTALLEVGNLMERIAAIPYEELSAERARKLTLSRSAQAQLTEPVLNISVDADPQDASAKRIRIELRWLLGPMKPAAPVRMAAWVYPVRERVLATNEEEPKDQDESKEDEGEADEPRKEEAP
jgi:Tfp pilus assembly protein PilE